MLINEILFGPPGTDTPHEYIELRGTPNYPLPTGTYLIALEGDSGGDPGTIQHIFDLTGRIIGGNGFLVLLQRDHLYPVHPDCAVLTNSGGAGWGSGASSSIGHRGESNQTELEPPSATYMLIQTPAVLTIGADIDSNDDGTLDGSLAGTFTILDSVAILDDTGSGDIGYGDINFRRNSGATVTSGTIVSVSFTPGYVGRNGNTTGWAAADWVAGDNLTGSVPEWVLSTSTTVPGGRGGASLDHIGSPNFGAGAVPGVIVRHSGASTGVAENGVDDFYTINLNIAPGGTVAIQIDTNPQLQVSTDGGFSFAASRTLSLANTTPQSILVRAVNDAVIENTPHFGQITHTITSGTSTYPVSTFVAPLDVTITDDEFLVLSEVKVNPPGMNDGTNEFMEVRATPNSILQNIYLLVINGDSGANPGTVTMLVSLNGVNTGNNGLIFVAAPGHPYSITPGTTVIADNQLTGSAGALGNGTISFLLVQSPTAITEGEDLDFDNNGTLEELPDGAFLVDALGWSDGGSSDIVYGGVTLTQDAGTPDAATRFGTDNTTFSAAAWFNGDLLGTSGNTLLYDESQVSDNFPAGTRLSPGALNNTPPAIAPNPIQPICGVIGDPTNPKVQFTIADESGLGSLTVTATSSNALVVPNANLTVTAGAGGARTLTIDPIGVGYSHITISVSDGTHTARSTFQYAASEMGRPGGHFHIGAADGSTAIAIDANHMFVADDENQTLRLYRRHESGYPIWEMDFNPFLGLTDFEGGRPREVDTEGSTRVGNRIYWMGGHSHANIGEGRTNRTRIFVTDMVPAGANSTLSYVGRYHNLKADLVNWDQNNGHGKGANYFGFFDSTDEGVEPKAANGFNIEGLGMITGSSTAAFLGFRAPIIPATNRVYSLIVPVLNFTSMAEGNAAPVFGAPIELDLQGRGVRSIEGINNNYLIIAGPPGDINPGMPLPNDFKLYTWTGNPADRPQERAADLSGLNPEGIVELPPLPWTDSTQVQILTDNGRTVYYGDDITAKLLPVRNFRKTRSDIITLGPVVTPKPYIISVQNSGADITITWRAIVGRTYRIQFNTTLPGGSWSSVSGDVTASSPIARKTFARGVGAQRFYRVQLVP